MSETENKQTLITFLDAVGRTIVGEPDSTQNTDTHVAVKNPVVLHIVPQDQSGRMSVQLLPIYFREFLADKTGDVVVKYNKESITETNIEAFDFRLQAQYSQMFNKSNIFVPPSAGEVAPASQASNNSSVINLFDE
jgi:hypothetical protein